MRRKILLFLFLLILLFTRLYNLEYTARFTEDESGFLVRAHQIFIEKKVTLVGQLNQQGTKVFSSLSIYLLLPVAVIGKFDPVSVFYGASFYGVITALVMLLLVKLLNREFLFLSALLILFWYPLLKISRWAWNPNFIPLWIVLAILLIEIGKTKLLKNKNLKNFSFILPGIFLGLSIHQHYYAIFAVVVYALLISIQLYKLGLLRGAFLLNFGIVTSLLPFLLFDLKHPPGIFLSGSAKQVQALNLSHLVGNIVIFSQKIILFYTQYELLAFLFAIPLILLIANDIFRKRRSIVFLVPILFQLIVISSLSVYFDHYFFVVIPFIFIFLLYPREDLGKLFSVISVSILVISGLIQMKNVLTRSPVEPDLTTVKMVDKILEENVDKYPYSNIAVLSSPDMNTHAQKYRDLILIPNNKAVMSHDEYFSNNYLFVVTTEDESVLRKDPALEMNNFRDGEVVGKWSTESGLWTVFLFGK